MQTFLAEPPMDFKFHCDSINILRTCWTNYIRKDFKFHCDSINIHPERNPLWHESNFKFHCDSINIVLDYSQAKIKSPLNSTVILLIFEAQSYYFSTLCFKFHCDSINMYKSQMTQRKKSTFKFHCDSINIQTACS